MSPCISWFKFHMLYVHWMLELQRSVFSICEAIKCWKCNEASFPPISLLNVTPLIKRTFRPWVYWMLKLQWSVLAVHEDIEFWNFNEVSMFLTRLLSVGTSNKNTFWIATHEGIKFCKFNEASLPHTRLWNVGTLVKYPRAPSASQTSNFPRGNLGRPSRPLNNKP